MFLENCRIFENIKISDRYFLLKFIISQNFLEETFFPGQFLEVKISDGLDILFRRPFAIFDYDKTTISILYHVVGDGTRKLSLCNEGSFLNVIYPLGNGYPYKDCIYYDNIFIIAGGIGFASIYDLIKKIVKISIKNIFIILGFKSKSDVFCLDFINTFENFYYNVKVIISTDDGTFGEKGNVIDVFRRISNNLNNILVFSCGSYGMLKNLCIEINKFEKNIKAFASFEKIMGCGIGICNGCSIKLKNKEFKKVCKDGPVFDIQDVVWD